jgi:hypothetical protein
MLRMDTSSMNSSKGGATSNQNEEEEKQNGEIFNGKQPKLAIDSPALSCYMSPEASKKPFRT